MPDNSEISLKLASEYFLTDMDLFLEEHKKILLLLLKNSVDFILIGGYAVIYYGYERTTGDMDLWLKPTNENRDNFINALKEHGVEPNALDTLSKMKFTEPQVLYIGKKPNKIDFMTKIQGLSFEEAADKKVLLSLEGQHIPVIHYDHLIISKMLMGRSQDKADVEMLQKIQRLRNRG